MGAGPVVLARIAPAREFLDRRTRYGIIEGIVSSRRPPTEHLGRFLDRHGPALDSPLTVTNVGRHTGPVPPPAVSST